MSRPGSDLPMGRRGSARADVTVVSVHSHERGRTPLDPAEFLIDFAHAVIDAGADVVAGNGPHCRRGIEMYHGRPIFFSLGNFVAQFELQTIISSHTYEVFGASPELTAHQIIGGDLLGFATIARRARRCSGPAVRRRHSQGPRAVSDDPGSAAARSAARAAGHRRRGRAHPERHGHAVRQVRNIRDQQRRHGPHHRAVDPSAAAVKPITAIPELGNRRNRSR